MSLDVYLKIRKTKKVKVAGIYYLDDYREVAVSDYEWNLLNYEVPLPAEGTIDVSETVYEANITHNLNKIASAVSETFYQTVWRPEELGFTFAHQLIANLEDGIRKLKENPAIYRAFNSPNGWGTYDQFVPWLQEYLEACKEYPDAEVFVSR